MNRPDTSPSEQVRMRISRLSASPSGPSSGSVCGGNTGMKSTSVAVPEAPVKQVSTTLVSGR